ncbi:MAG: ribosome silencing factor [Defluviitaleaceae bacterium]|nr:ribosome silencing factor [Defluviitaleaceae bacterium]
MEKLKKLIVALDSKHLTDMVVLDMRKHSALYDFMVISTAKNERIIAGVLRELKDLDADPTFSLKYIEGHRNGQWVLADFGDIVVHVFNEEMRTKYHLEKLWGDAERVDFSAWLS